MTRNERMFRRYQDGESLNELAAAYGLTRQRVEQIVIRFAAYSTEALRPRLKMEGRHLKVVKLTASQAERLATRTATKRAIAQELNVSQPVLKRAMDAAGIVTPCRDPDRERRIFETVMDNPRMTWQELGNRFGLSTMYAWHLAHRYAKSIGVELPPRRSGPKPSKNGTA